MRDSSISRKELKSHALTRIDEILDGVIWTHKIHEKQADYYFFVGRILSLISTISLAMTGSGVVVTLANEAVSLKYTAAIIAAILSAISLFVSLWNRIFDFEGRAKEQRAAAKIFLELREKGKEITFKISIDCLSDDEILNAVDDFSNDYVYACKTAPSTTNHAVKKASQALREEKPSNE